MVADVLSRIEQRQLDSDLSMNYEEKREKSEIDDKMIAQFLAILPYYGV